jgi:hypothetical protein
MEQTRHGFVAKGPREENNGLMERQEYDLFPLILGLTLASAGAFGWYLAVGARHAPNSLAAKPPAAAMTAKLETPAEPAASSAAPQLPPASAPSIAPSKAAANPSPPAVEGGEATPTGTKIWQCDVNGQRVFADFKCASDAEATEPALVNRMNPTPVPPRRYPVYSAPPVESQEPDYYGGDESANAPPVYVPSPAVYAVRPRPMHPHRPPQHAMVHHGDR